MKISILISNYNYEKYIRQAIESVLVQTYSHVEIVVVDDGSTDNSREIIKSFGDKVCPVFKENGGQASGINHGFAHASGDIILLLDADDYLHPTAVERIVAAWKPETGVMHHRLAMVREGKELDLYLPDKRFPLDSGDLLPKSLKGGGMYCCPPTSGRAYSRSILEKILPIPEKEYRICADDYLRIKTPFFSHVVALDETLAYYRVHTSNNYGGGIQRRFTRRAKIEERLGYLRQGYRLAKEMAEAHRVAINDENSIYRARDLFNIFLLEVSSPTPKGVNTLLQRALSTIHKIWSEGEYNIKRRFRESVILILMCFAPRPAVKAMYPGLFAV